MQASWHPHPTAPQAGTVDLARDPGLRKIGFVGAPGAGKTTIAQNFASRLRYETKCRVELIDEFAREFVSRHGKTRVQDQYLICHRQIDREREAAKSADFLVTDSPSFLPLVYAYDIVDWSDPKQVEYLFEIYSISLSTFHGYDHLFYLPPIAADLEDGRRVHVDRDEVLELDAKIHAFMQIHKIRFVVLEGNFDAQLSAGMETILTDRK